MASFLMEADNLCDLILYGHNRVKGGHGILEDHGNLFASDVAQLFLAHGQDILSVQLDAAVYNHSRRSRNQL